MQTEGAPRCVGFGLAFDGVSCQGVPLNRNILLLHFGWVDSHTDTLKYTSMSTCTYAVTLSCTQQPPLPELARQLRCLQRSAFFPWSVKAKFHTQIPSTFFIRHTKTASPLLKCLRLHAHQSRGSVLLVSFMENCARFL